MNRCFIWQVYDRHIPSLNFLGFPDGACRSLAGGPSQLASGNRVTVTLTPLAPWLPVQRDWHTVAQARAHSDCGTVSHGHGPGHRHRHWVSIWILATLISSVQPSISNVTFDIEDFDIESPFDIDVLHLRYRMSISKLFDIEDHQHSISKVINRVVDIEASCLRYRTNTIRHRMLISYTISKVDLTFDIDGHVITCWVQYRIRYSIQPMSFTAERKLPLPQAQSLLRRRVSAPRALDSCWILHPLFAHFHSLFHRDLTRKGPFIAPHPRVDFEQPAGPCSWSHCRV